MHRSEILGMVYDAVLHRPDNAGIHWYLCWMNGKIECLPMGKRPRPEIIFRELTTKDLESGFTTDVWASIESRIFTFLEAKGLCQIQ